MRHTVFLNRRRDVDIMRALQRMQRVRKTAVVIRHRVFAEMIGCSESSLRRSINSLVASGHIQRAYVKRPTRGGYLCVYRVDTGPIYRVASLVRRANAKIEQVLNRREQALPKRERQAETSASKRDKYNNNNYNRRVDKRELKNLMSVAKVAGIDDQQRGFLRLAAIKYGVRRAHEALYIAYQRGYALADIVRVTWGILKRQETTA